jgi:phosphoribosylformimino-5-aminoimidazole carboxamide ribotide isomerase
LDVVLVFSFHGNGPCRKTSREKTAMRVIGVVDLAHGGAVHASGGQREHYAPVSAVAGSSIEAGDALALARAFIEDLGLSELYVADLDAIAGGPTQDAVIAALTARGAPVWLDAGVTSVERAQDAVELGAAQVVVGLETLQSFAALAAICAAVGGDRVAFSLDLRSGQPQTRAGFNSRGEPTPNVLAAHAAEAGVGSVIVIDLARVGAAAGLDLAMIAAVREAVPQVTLLVGGGVRGAQDLEALADIGCDGALVATALLDGRLTARLPPSAAARDRH